MSNVVEFQPGKPARRRAPSSLTAARIRALKPERQQYWVADGGCPNLYVRVQPTGEMSFYIRGRIGSGRSAPQRNIRLGDVLQIGLSDARSEAFGLLAKMRAGNDPIAIVMSAPTIGELAKAYCVELERRGVVNVRQVASSLDRNLAICSTVPADKLGRSDFIQRIEDCGDRSGPAAANAFRGFCAAMLNWAVNTGALKSSVWQDTKHRDARRRNVWPLAGY